ncbi:MAG: hypothetical protein EOP92_26845 [Lysobacteraceae bacterium]|nr:MAG: hypothetical protein EOP92_26845 [Xanthomonadaceae bacterium]
MNNSLRFYLLLVRLSIGALALAFGLLTLAAMLAPGFAAALMAQGMPTPLNWPAALLECALALAAFFVREPAPGRTAPRTAPAGMKKACKA